MTEQGLDIIRIEHKYKLKSLMELQEQKTSSNMILSFSAYWYGLIFFYNKMDEFPLQKYIQIQTKKKQAGWQGLCTHFEV
jgi:hypothetical protein